MLSRPSVARPPVVELPPQQQLGKPVTGPHQIHADVLAGPHQVAQLLLFGLRHPDGTKLSGQEQASELGRVALVGLDPVLGSAQDVARGADRDRKPAVGGAAREPIARGARLIDGAEGELEPPRGKGPPRAASRGSGDSRARR